MTIKGNIIYITHPSRLLVFGLMRILDGFFLYLKPDDKSLHEKYL
jgi:hypothetical protein